jgi:hypothetical protein
MLEVTSEKYLIFCNEVGVNSTNNSFKSFLNAAMKLLGEL